MKLLLDNKFAPLTFSWGFLEAPLDKAADTFLAWRKTIYPKVERKPLPAPLPVALLELQPLTTPPTRELLLATSSPWVAYFNNGARVHDAASPVGHMCKLLKCR